MRIRFKTLYAALLLATHGAHAEAPLAAVDLMTSDGAKRLAAQWRYSDVELVPTQFKAPDANGQPYGKSVNTFDYRPHAGIANFNDAAWPIIAPESLATRRGHGRVSFNWYRLAFTVPDHIGAVTTRGAKLVFTTAVDDYAEIWLDGELARGAGQRGGSVVAGWNADNEVVLTPRAEPGETHHIAIFGINGPISAAPTA